MPERVGTLRMRPSGGWSIAAPGREPVDIVAGEVFLLEVLGERRLKRVRMMQQGGQWRAALSTSDIVERRVELRDGLRAEFFDRRERYARELK
jgi:hypothetical protein